MKPDAAGKLIRFRAIPQLNSDAPKMQAKPDWQECLPKEFTGLDLSALEPTEERGTPPPDGFDHMQVWKGSKVGSGGDFYVQAAVFAGKPVFFNVISPAEFEGRTPLSPMWLRLLRQTPICAWITIRPWLRCAPVERGMCAI